MDLLRQLLQHARRDAGRQQHALALLLNLQALKCGFDIGIAAPCAGLLLCKAVELEKRSGVLTNLGGLIW